MPTGHSPPDAGDSPKERLITAGAGEFAAHGFNGASIRRVTAAAETNVAAVKYYFDSKEGLYQAVVQRFFDRIRPTRQTMLGEARCLPPDHPDRVDAILRAMIAPHLRLLYDPDGKDYLQLLSRFAVEPRALTIRIYLSEIGPVRQDLIAALADSLPQVDRPRLVRCFGFVAATMVAAPFDRGFEALFPGHAADADPEGLIDAVVGFCAAGLQYGALGSAGAGAGTGAGTMAVGLPPGE
ncbi:TetR family transcriptional regulator [Rhodothalassium salexigens DSM 2132]|uniref:TetR family transcriptional regulator n=1 Tax=Rhodothalassium salexigens DSM 2132 TaxID=1188247 RepID=A0A4R2PK47_RHOSA|nr:TetR family transcriptional regulator [Rhodothalassium salexigens]MBB4211683.1 AcrR family transcriptional regulator [Rhodothalassium salexigens DSM 2132]MBK1639284.1 hypothetical protein [Rhodothalassium salexigens DSM 2132]TCP34385.1 TetR family transcriptional regulator [Rhodothalassium salexigens DSM 2132]